MQVKLSKTFLGLYLLILLWLVLFKFSLNLASISNYQTGLNLVPFAGALQNNPGEMIFNFVVFIPFGLLLSVNLKRAAFWRKFAFVFVFSLIVEIIQFVFAIGATDITDVITNSSGGLLGLLLYGVGSKYAHHRKLDRYIVVAGTMLLISVIGILFSGQVRFQAAPAAKATLSQKSLAKDAYFAWPAAGQGAVGTVEDGLIARSSNNENPQPMASMAKVVTALAILDKQPLTLGQAGESYTLTAEDVANYRAEAARGGSVVPVYEGMVVSQYQAMQMMLIASANNMADVLAERVFGSKEAYVSYAQNMLQRKGFSRTVVADASGFSPITASTPSELIAIGIEALSNPIIAEIVAQPQTSIAGVGSIKNTNELLGTDGVVGIKTGTTDSAGNCLLFAANHITKDGKKVTVVGVIMGDTNAASLFSDSKKLLASARQSLGLTETQPQDDAIAPPSGRRDRAPRQ